MKKLFVASLLLGTAAIAQDQLPEPEQANFDATSTTTIISKEVISQDIDASITTTITKEMECNCNPDVKIDVNDPAYVACIAAYLQRTIKDWSCLSQEEQQRNITEYQEDEQTFNELVAILRDTTLDDEAKLAKFKETFSKLHNKNHNAESGTILAAIISFTEDLILDALVAFVTEHGVTTKRLPGEFAHNRYFADKAPMTDRVKDQVQETYGQVKQAVSDMAERVKDTVVDIKDKVADKLTSKSTPTEGLTNSGN